MSKFTFHKDQFGVYVFYAHENSTAEYEFRNSESGKYRLRINKTVDFDPLINCVVPPIKTLAILEIATKVVNYKSNITGKISSVAVHVIELARLQAAVDCNDNPNAITTKHSFEKEWLPVSKLIERYIDYDFDVIDIEYPADERLIPLRHLDNERVNYFEVDGIKIALKFAKQLCENVGLKDDGNGEKSRTFWIPNYGNLQYWTIEGRRYGDYTSKIKLYTFTGDLAECRNYINTVERGIRAAFDEWEVSYKRPSGLTIGVMTKYLDEIQQSLSQVDTKVRTKGAYCTTRGLIQKARQEIVELEMKKEDLDNSFDDDIS